MNVKKKKKEPSTLSPSADAHYTRSNYWLQRFQLQCCFFCFYHLKSTKKKVILWYLLNPEILTGRLEERKKEKENILHRYSQLPGSTSCFCASVAIDAPLPIAIFCWVPNYIFLCLPARILCLCAGHWKNGHTVTKQSVQREKIQRSYKAVTFTPWGE